MAAFNTKPTSVAPPNGEAPPATPAPAAKKFAVPTSVTAPRSAPKVWGAVDTVPEPFRIFAFGAPGTGKTYMVKQLLLAGFKVFYVSTDIGGLGLRSFLGDLRKTNPEVLKNLRGLEAMTEYADVVSFLYNPLKLDPGIWEWDPDFIVWDGFSSFQQYVLSMEIQGGAAAKVNDLTIDNKEWTMLKNGTMNAVSRFNTLANPATGKILHKLTLGTEDLRNKPGELGSAPQLEAQETYMPWIQGASRQAIAGAFDLIIRTGFDKKKAAETPLDKAAGFRYYLRGAKNKMPKARGVGLAALPEETEADLIRFIDIVFVEEGITRGMIDPMNIAPPEN